MVLLMTNSDTAFWLVIIVLLALALATYLVTSARRALKDEPTHGVSVPEFSKGGVVFATNRVPNERVISQHHTSPATHRTLDGDEALVEIHTQATQWLDDDQEVK